MSLAYFAFYPNDFIGATCHLSNEQAGAYIKILCFLWQKERSKGDYLKAVGFGSVSVGLSDWEPVAELLQIDESGLFYNRRLEEERIKATKKHEAQVNNGKKGGRPKTIKPNESQNKPMANPQAKPNESNHNHNHNKKNIKENKEPLVNPLDLPPTKETLLKESCLKGFEQWWNLYDKKRNKKDAQKKWLALSVADMKKALAVVSDYTNANDKEFRKDPDRYLGKKSFNDEIILPKEKKSENNLKEILDSLRPKQELNEINEEGEVMNFRQLMVSGEIGGVAYDLN